MEQWMLGGLLTHGKVVSSIAFPFDLDDTSTPHALEGVAYRLRHIQVSPNLLGSQPFCMLAEQSENALSHSVRSPTFALCWCLSRRFCSRYVTVRSGSRKAKSL